MRKLFAVLPVLLFLSASCTATETIRSEDLRFSDTDRLYHRKGESQPFTGIVLTYQNEHVIREETYANGKKNGPFKRWELVPRKVFGRYKEGRVKRIVREEGFFKDNVLDGRHVSRHDNGSIAYESFYRNGQHSGERKGWSKTGTLTYQATYSEGHRIGEELNWTAEGIPEGKNVWTNGRIVEATYYHRDGSTAKVVGFTPTGEDTTYIREWDLQGNPIVHHKEKYPDGTTKKTYSVNSRNQLHGDYREYYQSGKLKVFVRYSNGNRHGWYTERYENKNPKVKAEYRDGVLVRYYQEFEEDGTLRLLREYDKGTLLSEKTSWETE